MFSLPLTHAVKEKIHFLVSLPTLSNQDRELCKEAVLSAHDQAESRVLFTSQWRCRERYEFQSS